jgi:hypothetical protein
MNNKMGACNTGRYLYPYLLQKVEFLSLDATEIYGIILSIFLLPSLDSI